MYVCMYFGNLAPVCLLCSQVLDVLAAVREEDPHCLAQQIYSNSVRLFFPSEASKT